MRYFYLVLSIFIFASTFAQNDTIKKTKSLRMTAPVKDTVDYTMYRYISLTRDTTYVDTSLTIRSEYRHNYYRKDLFGYQSLANEGAVLQPLHIEMPQSVYPQMGYRARQQAFQRAEEVGYYSMATPFTDLYFKTVAQQGQSLDAFLSANVSPQWNFSIAYKGLRSLGNYINESISNGYFRFTLSHQSKSGRYLNMAHFHHFDFTQGENGGLARVNDFLGGDAAYDDPARLAVYSNDGKSLMKGKRLFMFHQYRLLGDPKAALGLDLFHQFNYERKYYQYTQNSVGNSIEGVGYVQHYGPAFVSSNLRDENRYNHMHNRVGVKLSSDWGVLSPFIEDYRYNYYFDRVLVDEQGHVNDGSISAEYINLGASYRLNWKGWDINAMALQNLGDEPLRTLKIDGEYLQNNWGLRAYFEHLAKPTDLTYQMKQSAYTNYNWVNAWDSETWNTLGGKLTTPWVTAEVSYSRIADKAYFAETSTLTNYTLVKPFQATNEISYLKAQVSGEVKVGKFGLDNTLLFQTLGQNEGVMYVPDLVTRNTLYYSDYFFKKALYLQTGVIFNYYTAYNAPLYNPIVGDFVTQNTAEVGGYPMLDFFVNAKIRTCRIYLKYEHFNANLIGDRNYLVTPNQPYRERIIRFGLIWDFFQ